MLNGADQGVRTHPGAYLKNWPADGVQPTDRGFHMLGGSRDYHT